MSLTANEKAAVNSTQNTILSQAIELGRSTMERLFLNYPQTKMYSNHFDLTPSSADIQMHGGNHTDDLTDTVSTLSDRHANNLRVDPGNFRLLSRTLAVLATHVSGDFIAEAQAVWNKFFSKVSDVLTSKYR